MCYYIVNWNVCESYVYMYITSMLDSLHIVHPLKVFCTHECKLKQTCKYKFLEVNFFFLFFLKSDSDDTKSPCIMGPAPHSEMEKHNYAHGRTLHNVDCGLWIVDCGL